MQLRLALSVPKFTESLFKQSTSAILTGVTIAGAFATVIFQSGLARNQVNEAFSTFASLLQNSSFGSGVIKLGNTFKDWGTTLVGKKDDFKQWVIDYLNPEGFKSGAVELYNKLYDWAKIVFEWFRDKFWPFIKNIPDMVQNWKKLRISLFKWGTFLGGGGGSALWAMFGSGDNWGRLAELMGNEDFTGALEKFGELVENNPEAFGQMTEEEIKEIMEKMMDDPQGAKEAAEQLLEEQKKENEGKLEEEKKKELKPEQIKEAYAGQKGGKPKTPTEALGDFMSAGLKAIKDLPAWGNPFQKAKEALEKHIETLKKESHGSSEIAKIKRNFVDALKDEKDKNQLINSFAGLMVRAHGSYKELGSSAEPKVFDEIFKGLVREEFTKEASGEEEANAAALDKLDIKSS